jgi:hypothetical protein
LTRIRFTTFIAQKQRQFHRTMVLIDTFVSVGPVGEGELDRQADELGLAYLCNVLLPAIPPIPLSNCFPLRLTA